MRAFLVVSIEIDRLGTARRLETDSRLRLVWQLAALRDAFGPDNLSIPLGLVTQFWVGAVGWSASPWGLMIIIASAALLGGFELATGLGFLTGRLTSSSVSLSSLIGSDWLAAGLRRTDLDIVIWKSSSCSRLTPVLDSNLIICASFLIEARTSFLIESCACQSTS